MRKLGIMINTYNKNMNLTNMKYIDNAMIAEMIIDAENWRNVIIEEESQENNIEFWQYIINAKFWRCVTIEEK